MKRRQDNRFLIPLALGAALACTLYLLWSKDQGPRQKMERAASASTSH